MRSPSHLQYSQKEDARSKRAGKIVTGATGPLKRTVDILENSLRERAGRRLEPKLKLTKQLCGESVAASKLPPGSLKMKEKPSTSMLQEKKKSGLLGRGCVL